MYIFQKNMLLLYIKYMFYNITYANINVDIKYNVDIQNIYCMCVYLYMHNKYTQNILCKQNLCIFII